jgi:hypothetical protein
VVHVEAFADTSFEIVPRLSRGRGRSKHEVAIDNRGNVPLLAAITATDLDDAQQIRIRPSQMTCQTQTAQQGGRTDPRSPAGRPY